MPSESRSSTDFSVEPLPKLILTDGTQTLASIRDELLRRSSPSEGPYGAHPVDVASIAEILQIPPDNANLVLDTLASVLPESGPGKPADPLAGAKAGDLGSVGADVFDLILFLYIQSYKRLLPRTLKDLTSVNDVGHMLLPLMDTCLCFRLCRPDFDDMPLYLRSKSANFVIEQ